MDRTIEKIMNTKFFNNAIIGNKNIKATFSDKGELLRAYYPNVDFNQFIDFFHTGVKINDSTIIYLHEDINNKYNQYYTENTNILNTEIENTYFNLNIKQTDFISIKNNLIIKKYTFANNNKVNLNINFIAYSKLLTNQNNMISGKIIDNGIIQYNHDFAFCTFAKQKISGHRLNDVENYIRDGILTDKDYIGMSEASAVTYNLGELKPGDKVEFSLFIFIENNNNIKNIEEIEDKITELEKIDVNKEYSQAKKYWNAYLQKHDGLKIKEHENIIKDERIIKIYNRTILLFPLLQNEETGGVSAALEIDEQRQKSGRYSYCWPRDSVFVTKAFDKLNMVKETEKFYENFCKRTQSKNGMWEQRFYTDCRLAPCWGYQIDETASVIYGIYEHYKEVKNEKFIINNLKMCENALHFLFKYLENIFNESEIEEDIVKKEIEQKTKELGKEHDKIYKHLSYDLWEMNEGIHIYSLASIYSAMEAMLKIYEISKKKYENNRLRLEQISKNEAKIKKEINNIKKYIENNLYDENTKILKRNVQDNKMDISIMGTVYPFNLFSPKEKKILNTVEKINLTLRTYTGGYLRFEQDNYMEGQNPWPISTLWMALYYIKAGNRKKATECLEFVTKSATNLGFLAEQVDNSSMKPSWVIGLGWSHAMYIITLAEILKK
jgi:glucoamylase